MIPNENKRCSYRCAECGFFTLADLPTAEPVLKQACRMCENITFVRDLTAGELIELHALLAWWREERSPCGCAAGTAEPER